MERIADFLQSTIAGNGLGLLWLQGEAGVGKSRFLEHVRSTLSAQDNLVLYVRLYPDSALSIVSAFGAAIGAHSRLRQLLPDCDVNTPAGLTAALRRAAHLRPTLLIVDDIHLLDTEAAHELIELTDALQNEPISVVCAARPGSTPAYTALFHQRMRYVEIGPLTHEDLRQLVRRCYGDDFADDTTVARIYETTQGIPLIIRAAMAECLHKESDKPLYLVPPAVLPPGFHTKARLASEALVSCLMSDLDSEARRGTEILALLGEVFSIEAARKILGNRDDLIDIYFDNQIISTASGQPQPLLDEGRAKEQPIAFTHTLLHQHLASQSTGHFEILLQTIESGAPLYSVFPLLRVAEAPKEYAERGLYLLLDYTERLADSVNRGLGTSVYNGAVSLYEHHGSQLAEEVQLDIRLSLLQLRLQITAHIPGHPDFNSTLDQFQELTQAPHSEMTARHRLAALEYTTFRLGNDWEEDLFTTLYEAEDLIRDYPALLTGKRYHRLLGAIASAARSHPNSKVLIAIRERLEIMLNAPASAFPHSARRNVLTWIAGSLLPIFSSPEELLDRRYLAALIRDEFGEHPKEGRFSTIWPQFLEVSGDVMGARVWLQSTISQPLKGYNLPSEISLRLLLLSCDAALGRDLKLIEAEALHLVEEAEALFSGLANEGARLLIRTSITGSILLIGLLRGAPGWSRKLARTLCGEEAKQELDQYLPFERGAIEGDRERIARLFKKREAPEEYARFLEGLFYDESIPLEKELSALLSKPVFRRQDILRLHVAIGLGRIAQKSGRLSTRVLKAHARSGVERGLSWSASHTLPGYMEGLIGEHRSLFTQSVITQWNDLLLQKRQSIDSSLLWPDDNVEIEDDRLRISMIGTIGFRDTEGSFQRISGARTRHVLGLLTACKLSGHNCTLEEFRTYATAMEDSDEAANYLRIILSRLRRLLGQEAIVTIESAAPRFNLERVRVDVIEADRLIKEGMEAAHRNRPREAYTLTKKGLEAIGEEMVLPMLYDDIFETARREFEIHVRTGVLAVAELLIKEKDYELLIRLLRIAVKVLPEDEEIAELLTQHLRSDGQYIEALRTESRSQESFPS